MRLIAFPELASQLVADLDGRHGGPLPEWNGDLLPRPASGTTTVTLPDPTPPVHPLADVLRHRRAHRFYADRPVDGGDLHAVCMAATRETAIGALLAVCDVTGVVPGLHLYDRDTGSLTLLKEVPADSAARQDWFLQVEFAVAPVVIMILGSVGKASLAGGSHGYRRLLAVGGASAHRAWLAAGRRGLVGSMFAGLLHPALREVAGVDGWDTAGLIGLSLGHPRE